ncbi:hypothetical protein BASA81_006624 [Batrachochytrium salamandrivorans]|nr:hypothetical protein BASA81_006624 [Batrachochytrium salamandrivorans]
MFVEFDSFKHPTLDGSSSSWVNSIEFWPSLAGPQIFAALGGRRITIYEISIKLQILRVFRDEDEKEDFYCSCFTQSLLDNQPLICAGGESGIIKLVNLESASLYSILMGHGGPINDLKTFTGNLDLLFSCSKDESIRLWSISTRQCLAMFSGEDGHRNAVLNISLHQSMKWMATLGLDNSIKVWGLDCPILHQTIANRISHPPVQCIQFPIYTTCQNYIDCVEWVGDLLLSKTTTSQCILWKPDMRRHNKAMVICRQYEHQEQWLTKLSTSTTFEHFVVGGKDGALFIFSLNQIPPQQVIQLVQFTKPVQTVRFSPNNRWIVWGGKDDWIGCLQHQSMA